MRNVRWLAAAALVTSMAGCVETMDSGYAPASYGYGSSGYSDNGYYTQPAYYQPAPTYYYQPAPRVVTQTRYVPVPVPVATPAPHRTADHRWADRQSRGNPQPANTGQQSNRRRGSSQDRDGDGKPDAPRSDRRG
jgi:hypothetical protein